MPTPTDARRDVMPRGRTQVVAIVRYTIAFALHIASSAANGEVVSPGACDASKTMVHPKGQRSALAAVARVNTRKVAGDIVEVGVWMGGMSCMMALQHLRAEADPAKGAPQRSVWLFDTFQGMTPPTSEDGTFANGMSKNISAGATPLNIKDDPLRWNRDNKWNYGPLDEVRATMAKSNFPRHRVHFVVGPAEETLRVGAEASARGERSGFLRHAHGQDGDPPSYGHTHGLRAADTPPVLPERIAILRLDTDWYASTKAELEFMWSRLEPGGFMAVDDYYSWAGARKAVDEWLQQRNWTQAAHGVRAFGKGMVNYLYKNNPYNEAQPFG